jgi:3-deoxy-manno-octulosonate cytidylyltransferase (CMP-KDO synthetase)
MILGVIPARYASTRFPGKPLIDIRGKSMIQRVYERVTLAQRLDAVVVATDDERIASHVADFGGRAVLTRVDHPSGTDRCQEALQVVGGQYNYVINIQGDEPFIHPEQIDELAAVLDGQVELATQMISVTSQEQLFNSGEVKIALNHQQDALYFSREAIPHLRGIPKEEWHKRHTYWCHVGMYAYRSDVLQQITQLPVSLLEKAESLEQLRWLEAGFRIRCVPTQYQSACVDTPEDLANLLANWPGND